MSNFRLTEIQANAILDLRLARLAALERKKIDDEYKEVLKTIKDLEAILADPEKIRNILKAAGFAAIDIAPLEMPLNFGAADTLSDAVAYGLRIGPASRAIAEANPASMPAFTAAMENALRPYLRADGVWLDSAAWIVLAERA